MQTYVWVIMVHFFHLTYFVLCTLTLKIKFLFLASKKCSLTVLCEHFVCDINNLNKKMRIKNLSSYCMWYFWAFLVLLYSLENPLVITRLLILSIILTRESPHDHRLLILSIILARESPHDHRLCFMFPHQTNQRINTLPLPKLVRQLISTNA